ncbi:MAG: ATP-binding cassette domain-containing protein, partial [Candidatus Berkiella sp.]
KQEMAYLGHKDGINLNLTVKENVSLQVHLAKATLNREAFSMLLESLSLSSKADLPCYQLSQGQRRKVAICGLLLKRKAVWLLDEPFTSLDKASIDVVSEQIRLHLLAKGLVIMASHHAVNHLHQVVQL